MGPGGNTTTNIYTYVFNKYKGQGGVGASTIPIRNAKNRLASFCGCNGKNICVGLVAGDILANMNTSGMTPITFSNPDDAFAYLPFTGMDFYFFGTNYGNSNGTTPSNSIYMNTNYAFGFGTGHSLYKNWPPNLPAILFDFFDSYNIASYVSPPQNGTISGVKYVRIVATGTDFISFNNSDTTVKKAYEIYYVRDNCFQYMLFNCSVETVTRTQYNNTSIAPGNISNITNGTAFQNTFGSTIGSFGNNPPNTGGPQTGGSYVIRSDLNGGNWQFFPNTHLVL
jgi:hypothetical protein